MQGKTFLSTATFFFKRHFPPTEHPPLPQPEREPRERERSQNGGGSVSARQAPRDKASRERPKPRSVWTAGLPISRLLPIASVPRLPSAQLHFLGSWRLRLGVVAVSPGRMAAGPAEQGWRQRGEPGPAEMEPRPRSLVCSSQMEASLTCAVCLSLFEEPVTLPLCSHNFCRGCVLECLASAEAARLQQQQQRGQGQVRGARRGSGPGQGPDGDDAAGARVSCPLCRKLCPLPRGGAAALPVNTTLAEVVRLYRSNAARAGGSCQKHPGRLLQLYCRMCRQAGCGQCVSEEHQGVFHSINLIDTVYQEEQVSGVGLPSGEERPQARRKGRS